MTTHISLDNYKFDFLFLIMHTPNAYIPKNRMWATLNSLIHNPTKKKYHTSTRPSTATSNSIPFPKKNFLTNQT